MIFGGRYALVAACLVAASSCPSFGASLTDRPPPSLLRENVECMVRTLKAMPEINTVKSEVARFGGMPSAFVQYRDRSNAGQGATIRFETRGLDPPFAFLTAMGGLHTPGTALNDYGVRRIERAWKVRCNVDASTVFV